MPTPLAQALEEAARRQPPKPTTQLANALMEYASRIKGDFTHGLDESAQGFGEMMQGQLATGIPRTFLGGLGWMGSPVSGALSPILNPVMQPIAQGGHDYAGQPIENATGYPADLTTELALAAALPKALHGAGKVTNAAIPYLARIGDEVGARVGAPAGSYMSDPGPKAPDINTPILGRTDNAMVEAASNDLPSYKPLTAQQMIDMEAKGGADTADAMSFLQAKLNKNDKYYPADEVERALQILAQNPIRQAPRVAGPRPEPTSLGNAVESSRNVSELARAMAEFEANRLKARNEVVSFPPSVGVPKGTEGAAIPDTWYHGSPYDVYGNDMSGKFRLAKGETGVDALWASNDPFTAEGYSRGEMALQYDDAVGRFPLTRSWYKEHDGGGGVYGLKSAAKNPLVYDANGERWVNVKQGNIMREAKAKGHDAVIFKNIVDNQQNGGVSSDVIAFLDENAFIPDRKK